MGSDGSGGGLSGLSGLLGKYVYNPRDCSRVSRMKKHWWPPWAYESRPWVALVLGAGTGAGAFAIAVVQGSWSIPVTVAFSLGCALSIYGAVILQLRRDYRRTSKWERRHPHDD